MPQVDKPINSQTQRMCSFCGQGYTDGEGHNYQLCVMRLIERRDKIVDQLTDVTQNLRGARRALEGRG